MGQVSSCVLDQSCIFESLGRDAPEGRTACTDHNLDHSLGPKDLAPGGAASGRRVKKGTDADPHEQVENDGRDRLETYDLDAVDLDVEGSKPLPQPWGRHMQVCEAPLNNPQDAAGIELKAEGGGAGVEVGEGETVAEGTLVGVTVDKAAPAAPPAVEGTLLARAWNAPVPAGPVPGQELVKDTSIVALCKPAPRNRGACRTLCSMLGKVPRAASWPSRNSQGAHGGPVLLHFDVNKTVIHSDSVNAKCSEDGIREAVADLFWGRMVEVADAAEAQWKWTGAAPSLMPPEHDPRHTLMTYFKYCKKAVKDKEEFKTAVRTFCLATEQAVVLEMERVVQLAMQRLELPKELLFSAEGERELRAVGLQGNQYFIVPTLFNLVATLQRQRRQFAVLFRSFGKDHEKIQCEWNAFCELRHPVFSRLIRDLGPLDGSVPHLPDRRVHTLHTLYRDSQGPVLILDTFTNGPEDRTWDSWAKAKPKPQTDTREGRQYITEVLHAKTIEGLDGMQNWLSSHLRAQATSAIKDDWAWWQFHNEQAQAGKLLPLIRGSHPPRQVFFDDNIDLDDPRIVDCRGPGGEAVPPNISLGTGMCVKVNPVEALLEEDYFLRRLN